MKRLAIVALAGLAAASLGGCKPLPPCIRSHQEVHTTYSRQTVGKKTTILVPHVQTYTVCDQRAAQ